jgi:DNA-binding CsgD family transcriptional regulator
VVGSGTDAVMSDSDKRARTAGLRDRERARACFARRAWAEAHAAFSSADHAHPLAGEDLELLATSAYLLGHDSEYIETLERAHKTYLAAGDASRAARSAFWVGLRLLFRGEMARANGWLMRAERSIEGGLLDCVERGYLMLPTAQIRLDAGDHQAAYDGSVEAAVIGERFSDPDLVAVARHLQGRARLEQGRISEGLCLLDEAMVAVAARELSPVVTGLIYCSVIEGCRDVHALERAHEWTTALHRWCEEQPDMVAFTGLCRVHRAELMQFHGAWAEALSEAERAVERCRNVNERAAAAACYQQGEVHRLRGEFAAAEQAYLNASRTGWEPQPGLALLRLAQGRSPAAAAAIRRVVAASERASERAQLLPACVEIMLATGDLAEARRASAELAELAAVLDARVVYARAVHAKGAVELAQDNAFAAIPLLRSALRCWEEIEAPYLTARARELLGLCCRACEDYEGAELELAAAREVLARLGARPDLERVDGFTRRERQPHTHGLTPRELEVLRLVATGKSNKEICGLLFLSQKTIERHVSNIFSKLGVASRAAATAYAYQHELT